jgi:hypothetical protein
MNKSVMWICIIDMYFILQLTHNYVSLPTEGTHKIKVDVTVPKLEGNISGSESLLSGECRLMLHFI